MDNLDRDGRDTLLNSVARAKRQQVSAACQNCRAKKTKCDGQRPCRYCSNRDLECIYITEQDETRQHAVKRKFAEISQSQENLQALWSVLAGRDERQAKDVFRKIRAGQGLDAVVGNLGQAGAQQSFVLSYERQVRRAFLVALAQSNAPLPEIVQTATMAFSAQARINLPPHDAFAPLKDYIITLEILSGILSNANVAHGALEDAHPSQSPLPAHLQVGEHDSPLHWVEAAPWTNVTSNDEAVSHLVSMFLVVCNPFWRFLEEDLFLRDMRSKVRGVTYCSPLLVNAILAYAALSSNTDEAFHTPGQLLTRGEHFHDEAVRLWGLEEGRISLSTMQALLILAVESAVRGKDRLGWSLIVAVADMNKTFPFVGSPSSFDNKGLVAFLRARSCLAASVVWLQLSFGLGLLRSPIHLSAKLDDAPSLTNVLPDATVFWIGYPFSREPMRLRLNLMTRLRSESTSFLWDFICALSPERRARTDAQHWSEIEELAESLRSWNERLPACMCYSSFMPMPLFEFHAQYNCLSMVFWDILHETIPAQANSSDLSDDELESQIMRKEAARTRALECAYRTATHLRAYREAYGYKVFAPYVFKQADFAIFILFQDLADSSEAGSRRSSTSGVITDTATAFEETFRCILGWGVHVMLARGVARVIYQMVVQSKMSLPSNVQQMLKIVDETAWQASDLRLFNSMYPNYAMARKANAKPEDYLIENVLKKFEESTIGEAVPGSDVESPT